MSRASRRRRTTRRKTSGRSDVLSVRDAPEACECPACTGQEPDPAALVDALLADIAPLADGDDAVAAELTGAALLTMVDAADDDAVPAFVDGFVPLLESRRGPGALAVLRALGSVTSGVQDPMADAAAAAADRMAATGVPEPGWAAELAQPVQVVDCLRLSSGEGLTALVASFRRAGDEHAFLVLVDELCCMAAADIVVVDADQLPAALDDLRASSEVLGGTLDTQVLTPSELHWYVREALDGRAAHDEEGLVDGDFPPEDDDGPPYPLLAQLLRSRLATLPEPRKPAGARGHADPDGPMPTAREAPARMLDALPGGPAWTGGGRYAEPEATLPPKRKKKDGPAPTYQIKVGLRRAKPPIWRRLLVPGDVSLAGLHDVIQAAFGWDDGHMHVFETPYGDFGRADRELGHRAEGAVTLEQVAAQAKDTIRYTYDFGDDWEHEILVEKVLDPDPAAPARPTCTDGRRAAPPEDCGGIWGYAQLVEILADPRHPDHDERLEWLGLDDASDLDPAAFDAAEVNRRLATLPRR